MDYKYHSYINSMFPLYTNSSVQEDSDSILVVPVATNTIDVSTCFYYFNRLSPAQAISIPDPGEDVYYQIDLIPNLCVPRQEGYRGANAYIRHVFSFLDATGNRKWSIVILSSYISGNQYPSSIACGLNIVNSNDRTFVNMGWDIAETLVAFSLGTPPNYPQKIHFDIFYGHNGTAGKIKLVCSVNEVTVYKPTVMIFDADLCVCSSVNYLIGGSSDIVAIDENLFQTSPGAKVYYMAVRG